MARFIPSGDQGSPFPRSTAADSMGMFAQTAEKLGDDYRQYRANKELQRPLSEYLGVKPDDLPDQLKPFASTPVSKLRGLNEALGGAGISQLMHQQQPNVPLYFDQQSGKFMMGGPGAQMPQSAMPVPGAKAQQAVSALKPNSTAQSQLTPEQISTISDRIQHGDIKMLQSLPSFGANSPKSRVVAELAHRGVDITGMDLDLQARSSYIKTVNGPAFQNTYKYLKSVSPNLDKLVSLSDKIGRTFSKPLNRAQLLIMANSGDKDAAAFGAAAVEVSDQVAKILQGGGTGSATSDAKLKQAGDVLSGAFTPGQLKGIAQMLKGLLGERENALRTITVQTFGNQKQPKMPFEQRYAQLMTKLKDENKVFAQMHQEGY